MADISRIEEEFAKWESQQYAGNSKEKRTKLAQFFTPAAFAKALIDKLGPLEDKDILDPCLGSGNLIAAAVLSGADPCKCYGIELDEAVLEVAKKRLAELGVPEGNIISGSALEQSSYAKKFDCIVMNPPYCKNLHLKILAEAIKHLKDKKSVCVNLSPVLWLEDPHAHMKPKSNLFKFDNSIVHKCEQLNVVDKDTANQLFNTGLFANLGIYVCKKNAKGIDSKNFWKRNFEDWEVEVFDKVYALKTHIEDKCETNKRDGIRVPIAFIAGNRGTLPIYKDIAYVVDGMKDGKDWTKCKNNGGYEKEEGIPIPISIKFATEAEAQNFYDSWKTTFCRWLSKRFLFDQHIPLRFLPFLGDAINPRTGLKGYIGEWTDDDLALYFNITPEEQKIIEETMEKYETK